MQQTAAGWLFVLVLLFSLFFLVPTSNEYRSPVKGAMSSFILFIHSVVRHTHTHTHTHTQASKIYIVNFVAHGLSCLNYFTLVVENPCGRD